MTRPEIAFHKSTCASHAHDPTLTAAKCLNKTVKFLKETAHRQRIIPTLDMKTWRNVVYADASLGDVENAKTQGGRAVNLEHAHGKCSTLICRSGKLHRVAQSSFDAETLIAVDATGDGFGIALLLQEIEEGPPQGLLEKVLRRSFESGHQERAALLFPPHVMSDGKGTVQACYGTKDIACKRRQQDIASLREALQIGDVAGVHHLQGTKNPVDPLTKSLPFNAPTMQILEEMLTGKAPEKN